MYWFSEENARLMLSLRPILVVDWDLWNVVPKEVPTLKEALDYYLVTKWDSCAEASCYRSSEPFIGLISRTS